VCVCVCVCVPRPLYDQLSRRDGRIAPELRRILEWFLVVLEEDIVELREWTTPERPPVHLFCDARGHPPHLAAVLYADQCCTYTHMPAPSEVNVCV